MPKSSKKRKDKAADFAKAKLKLGKGKQAASNAIDTSFKARSITLPIQSIAIDKDVNVPTTKRKLTFDDLVAHLKHFNAGTRRDALFGFRELLEANPDMIELSLTPLVSACVRVIADQDSSVRKALLAFFGWLLRHVLPENLLPHAPLLLLFVTSAQTHIFPEIRVDAIRFLDLFLEVAPELAVGGWSGLADTTETHGGRVLEGYLALLDVGTKFGDGRDSHPIQATSTASAVLSSSSKLVVLKSLSTFLQRAFAMPHITGELSSSIHTWYMASSFKSHEAFGSFEHLLHPSICSPDGPPAKQWKPNVDVDFDFEVEGFIGTFHIASGGIGTDLRLEDLTQVGELSDILHADESSRAGTNTKFNVGLRAGQLARALHSTLVSTILDCAPVVFSPNANFPDLELQSLSAAIDIARSLYGVVFRGPQPNEVAADDLCNVLKYLSPYFPFGLDSFSKPTNKVEQALLDLNLRYCELTSLLVLASGSPISKSFRVESRARQRQVETATTDESSMYLQLKRVGEYIVRSLKGEMQVASQPLGRPLTAAAYAALLPTIWSLLDCSPTDQDAFSGTLLYAVLEHAIKTSSNSAVKRPTVEFVTRLILLQTEQQYSGSFSTGRSTSHDKKLQEWFMQLPRTLWELGGNNLIVTEIILRFILRLCQRRSWLVHQDVLSALRSRLIHYFIVAHPFRGELLGPYSKLPSESPLRRLVLDVVVMISLRAGKEESLLDAVDRAVAGSVDQLYWGHLKVNQLDS